MAKKGKWAKGKAPAQGSTPRRVSRPEAGKHQGGPFKRGKKLAGKKGGSPLDGRKKGKK